MRRPFQIRVYTSGGFFVAIDLDDFTALVKSTIRAHRMRQADFTAIAANG